MSVTPVRPLRAASYRTFAGQAVGGDTWQSLPAHVAEGRSGVRAGVPVVHPREVLHVELARLVDEQTASNAVKTAPTESKTLSRLESVEMETRPGPRNNFFEPFRKMTLLYKIKK